MNETARDQATLDLLDRASVREAMIISTCNRIEVYVETTTFHGGVADVVDILHEISKIDMETLRSALYVRYADAAAEHMMVVASGLDSMVIGEQQIIGQVRTAYQAAIDAGTIGPALHALVQAALHTGKRVHTETNIDEAGASMVSVAFEEALSHMQCTSLQNQTALVLGAGAMASLAATHLGRLGIQKIIVANRTRERAENLAAHARDAGVDAEVVDFDQRRQALTQVDLAVSATGSQTYTIAAADLPQQCQLMLIDLSMPRDIDDDVTAHGAKLVNIERLHRVRSDNEALVSDVQAQKIVADELQAYSTAQRIKDVAPAVTALRTHASELVDAEINRVAKRNPELGDDELHEIRASMQRVVDKLLHKPTVKAKELAAESGTISYQTALQEFFGLAGATTSVKLDYNELRGPQDV